MFSYFVSSPIPLVAGSFSASLLPGPSPRQVCRILTLRSEGSNKLATDIRLWRRGD